jgi:hypothetical protein
MPCLTIFKLPKYDEITYFEVARAQIIRCYIYFVLLMFEAQGFMIFFANVTVNVK